MSGRLSTGITLFTVLAFLAIPLLPGQAAVEAQANQQFRVLVPDLQPEEGTNSRFGERVAEQMRDHIDGLGTHSVVPEDEVRDQLREFGLSRDDLDCITARQLATQIDAQLVMCGTFARDGDDYRFSAEFIAVESGDELAVEPSQVQRQRGDVAEAADHIFSEFQGIIDRTRYAAFCAQDYQSRNWDSALESCNRAYELNPETVSVLFARARTFMELERFEDALADFEAVLEQDEYHEASLENAGWVATQLERTETALGFYERYLDLNPEATSVRLRVGYDLAQAGGHEEALQLVQEGLEHEPDNVDLWEAVGGYAFRAAQSRMEEATAADGGNATVSTTVEDLYETAIDAYNRVLEEKGADTPTSYLANTIRAYLQLGETDRAIEQAERSLAAREDSPQLHALHAQALHDLDEHDAAIEAMLRVRDLDEDYSNLYTRLGQWNLESGNADEALEYFRESVERGERDENQVARQIFSVAYNGYIQQDRYEEGIALLETAKEFQPGSEVRGELDFWHGFALFRRGEQIQEPQTVESAERALPMFNQARQMFEAGSEYADQMPQVNLDQFLGAVDQYVEIQELILRRGRR